MIFTPTNLQGSFIIIPEPTGDSRGWFARTYCKNEFAQIGHHKEWVQINHSFTAKKGTIRGLHFQQSPFSEIKMLRCIAGSIFDVIVDLRRDSASYLHWFGTELSAANKKMMYIPEGFAHGFQTLSDDAELIYHHSQFYAPGSEAGIRYDDPGIDIHWPLPLTEISQRDEQLGGIDENLKP